MYTYTGMQTFMLTWYLKALPTSITSHVHQHYIPVTIFICYVI